ncbi:hypothetical protein ACH4TX_41840 [Streptomyces sp. NPDC021098]|uniref:hypothetical protein n=1 Tax=unclassified Streptomyces TaxID=2593676 RepID=UPI0037916E9B
MGARLAATTHVLDPETHQMTELPAGSEPPPHLAALVTNPACWEDGKLPTAAKKTAEQHSEPDTAPTEGDGEGTKQAATKKAAARPARGRKSAADEGSSS